MTSDTPQYCALCGVPCETPLDAAGSAPPPPPATPGYVDLPASSNDTSWTHQWHITKLFKGCMGGATGDDGLPIGGSSGSSGGQIPRRQVPIHTYCLTIVLNLTRDSIAADKVSALGVDMLLYLLPLRTGWAPWCERQGEAERFHCAPATSESEYWRGTTSQLERWTGERGSHLLRCDMVSPLHLGDPSRRYWATAPRPAQTSIMANLPTHIHTEIMLHLLNVEPHDIALPRSGSAQHVQHFMLPSLGVESVLALADCCTAIDVPAGLWRIMIIDDVNKFKLSVVRAWLGVEGPGNRGRAIAAILGVLAEAFLRPIDKAINAARLPNRGTDYPGKAEEGDAAAGWEMRDVWDWWKSGEGWRSRRRVHYCVVRGCSAAQESPWW